MLRRTSLCALGLALLTTGCSVEATTPNLADVVDNDQAVGELMLGLIPDAVRRLILAPDPTQVTELPDGRGQLTADVSAPIPCIDGAMLLEGRIVVLLASEELDGDITVDFQHTLQACTLAWFYTDTNPQGEEVQYTLTGAMVGAAGQVPTDLFPEISIDTSVTWTSDLGATGSCVIDIEITPGETFEFRADGTACGIPVSGVEFGQEVF